MTMSHSKIEHIDPRSPDDIVKIKDLILKNKHLYHYTQYGNIILTHPVFLFEKPEHVSKWGIKKETAQFIAVYDTTPIGKGSYGTVHSVLGVYNTRDPSFKFKVKAKENTRVVKTNTYKFNKETAQRIYNSYNREFEIAAYMPHLSMKYAPTNHDQHSFLLLRELSGCSLAKIIKQLDIEPNLLSVEDRLLISINLLKALKEQLQNKKSSSSNDYQTIIHQDLKPANIIINDFLEVKFIDLGVSRFKSDLNGVFKGTYCYLDPEILADEKYLTDEESDLFSIGRVIAELWGDQSISLIDPRNDIKKIHHRNHKNSLINLFKGINDFDDEEKNIIEKTIKAMTAYHEKDRLSYKHALEHFETLYTKRVKKQEDKFKEIIKNGELDALAKSDLLSILNSNFGLKFIQKIKDKTAGFILLEKRIRDALSFLTNEAILNLRQEGFILNNLSFLDELIEQNNLWVGKLTTAIEFGVKILPNHLIKWLGTKQEINDYQWALVMQEMFYQLNESDRKDILKLIPEEYTFKSLFAHRCLANSQYKCDNTKIKQIINFIEILKEEDQYRAYIKPKLKDLFFNTPFYKFCETLPFLGEANYEFRFSVDHNLEQLAIMLRRMSAIDKFITKNASVKLLISQKRIYDTLTQELNRIKNTHEFDIPTLYEQVKVSYEKFAPFSALCHAYNSVQELNLPIEPDLLAEEFNRYFDNPDQINVDINSCLKYLNWTKEFALFIANTRLRITEAGFRFYPESLIENKFLLIQKINKCSEAKIVHGDYKFFSWLFESLLDVLTTCNYAIAINSSSFKTDCYKHIKDNLLIKKYMTDEARNYYELLSTLKKILALDCDVDKECIHLESIRSCIYIGLQNDFENNVDIITIYEKFSQILLNLQYHSDYLSELNLELANIGSNNPKNDLYINLYKDLAKSYLDFNKILKNISEPLLKISSPSSLFQPLREKEESKVPLIKTSFTPG